jgi:DNA-binding PadR family transcriptional regulator
MCGYEIMSTVKKTYSVNLGASTMYPALSNLESKNLVTNEWNMDNSHPKKVYKLTQEGKNELHYSMCSLSQICKTLDKGNKKTDKNIQMGILIDKNFS